MKCNLISTLVIIFIFIGTLEAHFQAIVPEKDIIVQGEQTDINIDVMFYHPFENEYMNMVLPNKFGVMIRGKDINLADKLIKKDKDGLSYYTINYNFSRPGDYIFYVEPKPYFEPAELKFIIHYTKVVVNAFGMEVGWDKEVGLKAEIIPLTRPYGLWKGNCFRGIVKVDGKPVPFCDVEVEYYNKDGKKKAPADAFKTQVIKTDKNGVFCYTMPFSGWWGFAALTDGKDKMLNKDDGKEYDVEIGAVMWVRCERMKD